MRFAIATVYVALMIYPAYLAGSAAGEDITAARLGAYAGAGVISVAAGFALRRTWMYALPWIVWGAWVQTETFLRVFTDERIFVPGDVPIGIAMLAVPETLALWLGVEAGTRMGLPRRPNRRS